MRVGRPASTSNSLMRLDYATSGLDENAIARRNGADDDMTSKAAARLRSDGWSILETTGFMHLIGPLWERKVDGRYEFALATEDKHHNRRGMVQGGVMMTFADRTCGMVRSTRSLVFMSAEVTVDDRCIVMANGVFKILKGPA
jgi:acyl-coenzyme A thioesterase PaaI-like protein